MLSKLLKLTCLTVICVGALCIGQTDSRMSLTLSGPGAGNSQYHLPVSNSYGELQRSRSPQSPRPSSPPPNLAKHAPVAKPLKNSTPVAQGVRSGSYVSSVGGVAFDQVAELSVKLRLRDVSVKYDANASDGDRLVVIFNRQEYRANDLYDWQIIPIAFFADSPNFAVVTLFGELIGQPRPATHYVVAYHPAFENTLLGLRMFQGDFLLLDPNVTGELPKLGSKYILGKGEHPPNLQHWKSAATTLNSIVSRDSFVSYVICDLNQEVRIKLDPINHKLGLTGVPNFYFWKKGRPVEERGYSNGRNVIIRSFEVEPVTSLTSTVSAQEQTLFAANPAVYGSLVRTLRFAALFRYLKREAPAEWASFLTQLHEIPPETYVAPTPVMVPKKQF